MVVIEGDVASDDNSGSPRYAAIGMAAPPWSAADGSRRIAVGRLDGLVMPNVCLRLGATIGHHDVASTAPAIPNLEHPAAPRDGFGPRRASRRVIALARKDSSVGTGPLSAGVRLMSLLLRKQCLIADEPLPGSGWLSLGAY